MKQRKMACACCFGALFLFSSVPLLAAKKPEKKDAGLSDWHTPGFTATRNPMTPLKEKVAVKADPTKELDPFDYILFTGVIRGSGAGIRAFINGELRKNGDTFTLNLGNGKAAEMTVVSVMQSPARAVLSVNGKEKTFTLER